LVAAVKAVTERGIADHASAVSNIKRTLGIARTAQPPDRQVEASVASDPPARSGSFPVGIVAAIAGVAVILVVAVIGIAFWAMSGSDVAAANSVKTTNTGKPPAGGNTQRVRVDVDEGKAQVIRDGQVVGTTPLDLDVAAGEKPSVTLRRDGYEDKTVQIEPTSGKKVLTFSLKTAK